MGKQGWKGKQRGVADEGSTQGSPSDPNSNHYYPVEEDFRAATGNGMFVKPAAAPLPVPAPVPLAELLPPPQDDLPEDVVAALSSLRDALEQVLFYWKEFPMKVPSSDLPSKRGKQVISLDQLFVLPKTPKELRSLAMDSNGTRRYLNAAQKAELRETGRFSVPSVAFPGKTYVWEVVNWLQTGAQYYRQSRAKALGSLFSLLYLTPRTVREVVQDGSWRFTDSLLRVPQAILGFMDMRKKFDDQRVNEIAQGRYMEQLKEDLVKLNGETYQSKTTGQVR
mgnify:CR=1 FL=1